MESPKASAGPGPAPPPLSKGISRAYGNSRRPPPQARRIWAHSWFSNSRSVLHVRHSLASPRRPDALAEARIHLAAAYRLAVLHELEEGIDNHLTMRVPGQEGRYLILPFGLHWSEASASNLVIYDDSGATVEGTGTVERSAHCIHTPIHRLTGAAVVLHTHQTWVLALNSLQDNRLLPTTQTAAFFDGQVAYDDTYTGVAASLEEGERLAG
jgi:ribulose-5-phosphate 4-epimerase/fuculose-1-phosphate aldolase